MIDKPIYSELIKHIIRVYDENNVEIHYNKLEYKIEKRQYSKTESLVIYIDGIALSRNQYRKYRVLYKCRCGREVNILLMKYMLKEHILCIHCQQDRSYDFYYVANEKGKVKKEKTKIEYNFSEMSPEFLEDYYKSHLTEAEYKIVLELKAENKFYRDDLESGRISAKNEAAIAFCKNNNMTFKFVFDYNLDKFVNKLLNKRDSLES